MKKYYYLYFTAKPLICQNSGSQVTEEMLSANQIAGLFNPLVADVH